MSSRIKLPKRLKSFQESNTASPSKGFISKGIYLQLETTEKSKQEMAALKVKNLKWASQEILV